MWNDPVTNTPSIVQTNFGPWGTKLPADGESYCAPTSVVMGLYYLGGNGFTQLAPARYAGPDDRESILFERLIAGMLGTSPTQGTTVLSGLADYFAARGLGLDQYTYVSTGVPDLQWLDTQLAPNYAGDRQWISLTVFSVGWFYKPTGDAPTCGCVHPDAGDPFWKQPRRWRFMMFPNGYADIWFGDGNFSHSAGNFGLVLEADNSVYLTWTPTAPQGPAQRRLAQARARRA